MGTLKNWLAGHFGSRAGKEPLPGSPLNRGTAQPQKVNPLDSTSHTTQASLFHDTWKLMKPYWGTKDGKKGWTYLSAVLALTVAAGMPSINLTKYDINKNLSLSENNSIDIKTVPDEQQPPNVKEHPEKMQKHLDIHAKLLGKEYDWTMKKFSGLGVLFAELNSKFVGSIIGAGNIVWTEKGKDPVNFLEKAKQNPAYQASVDRAAETLKLWLLVTGALVGAGVYSGYLRQKLHLDWRTSMTDRFLDKYFDKHTYYRLQSIYNKTDNPEQRIQQDVDQFTESTISIPLGLFQAGMMITAFSDILLNMSEKVNVEIGSMKFQGNGYLFWSAVGMSAVAGLAAYGLGLPLIRQTQKQEMLEADFRHSIGRIRENAESVAFLGGEEIEKKSLKEKFKPIAENWYKIMKTNKRIGWMQSYYGHAGEMAPFLLIAPAFMTGSITYDDLVLARSGFSRVDAGLNWFTNNVQALASWKATQNRLATHDDAVEQSIRDSEYNNVLLPPSSPADVHKPAMPN